MPYYPIVKITYWDGSVYRPTAFLGEPGVTGGAPSKPTDLDATVTTTTASLYWSASTPTNDDPVSYYRVFLDDELVAQPNGTTLLLTGLNPGTSYEVRVQAVPDSGIPNASALSDPFVFTTDVASVGVMLRGYAASDWAGAVSVLGLPQITRQYYGTKTAIPYPTGPYPADRPWATSWKPYAGGGDSALNDVAAGSKDAIFNAWLSKLPTAWKTRIYLVDHEPDVKINKGNFTPTPFCNAFNHYSQLVKSHPNSANFIVVMGNGGGAFQASWFTTIDRSRVDVVAFDPYGSGQSDSDRVTYAGGRKNIQRYADKISAAFPGKQLAIGEVGIKSDASSKPIPGTDAQHAEWIRGNFEYADDNGFDHICYFWNNENVIGADQPLTRAMIKAQIGN